MAEKKTSNPRAEEIPVYLFLGFLDAGKTKFIQETLEQPDFNSGEKTLLLLTEQGDEEYAPQYFSSPEVEILTVEEEEELTPDALHVVNQELCPERVIVEYNGMWRLDSLFASFPENWALYQVMLFADAATFPTFDKNMRPLTGDKLKYADLVVFNRMNGQISKEALHKIVRSVNRRSMILYEYPDGRTEQDTIVDPLPFDLQAEVITIKDKDYAIWYQDLLSEPEKYEGKIVKFRAQLTPADQEVAHMSAAGRFVMTCCEEDITFCGLVADWGENPAPKSGWFALGAKIINEYNPIYREKGPVLKILAAKPTKKPQEEIATFY